MLKRHLNLLQAGDTIVEVLICIVVIGLVFGGAYELTNINTVNERTAQEHSQALELLQSQIEAIRSAGTSLNGIILSANPITFCMYPNAGGANYTIAESSTGASLFSTDPQTLSSTTDGNSDHFGAYPVNGDCNFTAAGALNTSGQEPVYHVSIDFSNIPATTFSIMVRWYSLNSTDVNQEQLFYRYYPPGTSYSATAAEGFCGETPEPPICVQPPGRKPNPVNPAGPRYFYYVDVFNESVNPGQTAAKCVWTYGDGTSRTISPCPYDTDGSHCYTSLLDEDLQHDVTETITLTVTLANGTVSPPTSRNYVEPLWSDTYTMGGWYFCSNPVEGG